MKRVPIRGGNWNNAAITGVFALNLNNPRSNANVNIGARPASGDWQKTPAHAAGAQSTPQKDAPSAAKRVHQRLASAGIFNRPAVPVVPRCTTVRTGRPSGSLLASNSMAKTYNNLYEQVYDFEALHAAYLRARAGKRQNAEVQRFEQDLEGNLIQLQNELIWGSYQTGTYRSFTIFEPKQRQVAALPFRDRVVQHALVAVLEPIWERRFIADSYACRPGRGTHRGADRAQAMLRQVKREHGQVYVLKADIAAYFRCIDHNILKMLVRRRVSCRRILALFDAIIDSANPLHPDTPGVGLPIGNLTSQLSANIYLHELDEFVKHGLRERHYARYMDDFIVVHHDKQHLHRVRERIEIFLAKYLRLRTNNKTQVFPVHGFRGRALDFLGYRIWPTHRKLRRSSIRRITKTLKRLQQLYAARQVSLERISQSINSWLAHAEHANARGLVLAVLGRFKFSRRNA